MKDTNESETTNKSETAEPAEVRSKESDWETTPAVASPEQEKDKQDGVQSKKTYASTVKLPSKATGQPRMDTGKTGLSRRLTAEFESSQDEQHSSPISRNIHSREMENENTRGNSGSRLEQ